MIPIYLSVVASLRLRIALPTTGMPTSYCYSMDYPYKYRMDKAIDALEKTVKGSNVMSMYFMMSYIHILSSSMTKIRPN